MLRRPQAKSIVQVILIGVVGLMAPATASAQTDQSHFVRLFKLEGTFSEERSAKISSDDKSKSPGFALTDARLEADSAGFLTRLRALLTIVNPDASRRITEVEWRLDVFDESLRSVSARVIQTDKVSIYGGETGVASARFGAVLPDKMMVLLQLIRVSFADGPAWSSPEECSLGDDLRSVSCKSK
jgi:hypothetical protein